MTHILVAEDDRTIREAIDLILKKQGFAVHSFRSGEDLLQQIDFDADMLICDYKLPGITGLQLLHRMRTRTPSLESIIITAFGTIDLAVEAIKQGASDFLAKPFSPEELLLKVNQLLNVRQTKEQNEYLLEELKNVFSDYEIIGNSEEMKKVYALVN